MKFLCLILPAFFSFKETHTESFEVVGPEAPLAAAAGEDLLLPCFIQPNTSAVDMRVKWFRLDSNNVVHLYENNKDTNEKQHPVYSGRTSLSKEELQKGNASLKISALRVSDGGDYKCLVEAGSWYDDITVTVSIEALGSMPVITVESYDSSGGIALMCETRGWYPEPEVVWMNKEGDLLLAEDTQILKESNRFNVKCSITVYDDGDFNKFYCRIQQKHHMMESDIIISSQIFEAWKSAVISISVLALIIAAGFISAIITHHIRGIKRRKEFEDIERRRKELEDIERRRREELEDIERRRKELEGIERRRKELEDIERRRKELEGIERRRREELEDIERRRKELEGIERRRREELEGIERRRREELEEFAKKSKYAVDVTLDPDTASPYLIVSEDGKEVSHGDIIQELSDTPQRFDYSPCVLGRQGFSSERFYYEVQVSGKTDWDLGVARESINRTEYISLIFHNPVNGLWRVVLRNGNEYSPCSGPAKVLTLKEKPEKVGVYVDYEEGLVSFWNVENRSLIYSFTKQTFTEKLYPFFSPFYNQAGENSAPLIISPVSK